MGFDVRAQGLEDLLAELLENWDVLSGAGVVDAIGLGSSRALEFSENKIF